MPRKSNKTEQVLRLITKSGDRDDIPREEPEKELPTDVIPEEPNEADLENPELEAYAGPAEPEPVHVPEPEPSFEAMPDMRNDVRAAASQTNSIFMDEAEKERLKAELKEEIRREFKESLREETLREEREEARRQMQQAVPIPEIEPEPVHVPEPEPMPEPEPEPVFDAPPPVRERELKTEGPTVPQHKESPPVRRDTDYEIVNLSELLASELMTDVMKKLNVCDCQLCRADVLALTLNLLPQKYVTTDSGKQFMQLNMYRKQFETEALSALTKACVRVKGSPRHS